MKEKKQSGFSLIGLLIIVIIIAASYYFYAVRSGKSLNDLNKDIKKMLSKKNVDPQRMIKTAKRKVKKIQKTIKKEANIVGPGDVINAAKQKVDEINRNLAEQEKRVKSLDKYLD